MEPLLDRDSRAAGGGVGQRGGRGLGGRGEGAGAGAAFAAAMSAAIVGLLTRITAGALSEVKARETGLPSLLEEEEGLGPPDATGSDLEIRRLGAVMPVPA